MVTDRYLHVHHQPDVASLVSYCAEHELTMVGVDNLPGAVRLETTELPLRCCLVFGSEGQGLTDELAAACERLVAITQYGSTRSMNAGAAAAIAMYHWRSPMRVGRVTRGSPRRCPMRRRCQPTQSPAL